jgi:hypothetical protein
VHSRENHHGDVVRILVDDPLVHLKQVSISRLDHVAAQTLNRVTKIQIDRHACGAHAPPFIADLLGASRRDVARREVTKGRVLPFEVVIAIILGNLIGRALVILVLWHPDAPVIPQAFTHQREFGLVIAVDWNARGMNLRVTRIGKVRPAFMRPPRRRHVGRLGIRGQVEHVAVSAGRQYDRIRRMRLDPTRHQVPAHDPPRLPVDNYEVQHFAPGKQLDAPRGDFLHQRAVRAQQQLLPRLAARIKRPADLRTAERAVRQQPAVFTREGHALRHALIDDVHTQLGEPIHVRLAGAKVSPLYRVVKQAIDTVPVVLVVLRRVDAALRGNTVCTARTVVDAKGFDPVSEFGKRRRCRCPREPRAHNNDCVLPLVRGAD